MSAYDPVIQPEPGGRSPAPGPLRLVQQFVNTNDREGELDALADPARLATWFRHWTTWSGGVDPTPAEHVAALVVREGLRDLGGHVPPGPDFARQVADLDVRLVISDSRLRLVGTGRLAAALVPLLEAVVVATADGSWERLKVCQRDRCRWMYYDSSRNHSSRWCATEICGSREKAARAYRRRKGGVGSAQVRLATGAELT